jgi:hypothetical protein
MQAILLMDRIKASMALYNREYSLSKVAVQSQQYSLSKAAIQSH